MQTAALSDLKVVELGSTVSAPFCARLLASFGAEVIKVEKPETGDGARRLGPFPRDIPHPEGSGLFQYLNADKMSVTLNLETETGLSMLMALVEDADVLVENNPRSEIQRLGLGYDTLEAVNPRLIMTSITPFGHSGPYRDYKATDLISFHAGGLGYITPRPVVGLPDKGPLRTNGHLADFIAGLDAAAGTMCALFERDRSGSGQHLDISEQESVASGLGMNVAIASFVGGKIGRVGAASYQPVATMACKDGYVDIQCITEGHWQGLVELMGDPDWAHLEIFKDLNARGANWEVLEPLISDWLMTQGKQEFFRSAQAKGVPSAPVNTIEEVVESDQFAARDFFVEMAHPDVGAVRYPGPPLKLSQTPARAAGRAPLLGEHNQAVYCDRLGHSRQEMEEMKNAGVI